MQRSIIIGRGRIVISAHGVAGTKPLPFQSGPENLDEPTCDLDETAQRALIACGGGVDQDPALNRLPVTPHPVADSRLPSMRFARPPVRIRPAAAADLK
jgi:hypothetical protein